MLPEPELIALADANLAEFAREHARWLPPTQIEEQASVLLTAAGTRFPAGPWNCLMPLGDKPAEPQQALATARQFFARQQRSFSVYVRAHLDSSLDELCQAAGCMRISDSPGMVLTQPIARVPLPADACVREVQSSSDAQAFVRVMAEAYESLQLPAAMTEKLLSHPERWRSAYCRAWLICEAEAARAGAMVLFSHGIAGVYWVGTESGARRRGYAEAVMRATSDCAFERGARAVILQASKFGEPLYRRLGFREFTRYSSYLVTGPRT